ncbi:hypothetical protein JD844_010645 [Phrynosoma platyrhinos]|uniref:C-type lectin domain-containing protein n=1 Tax=Phrynosoma platyrhinos TaxID=52577 RepID=A0ABQ7THK9_PHRPL|nr:hypothetical protein JD844_010645 [Phrynosoma platyrhinos]
MAFLSNRKQHEVELKETKTTMAPETAGEALLMVDVRMQNSPPVNGDFLDQTCSQFHPTLTPLDDKNVSSTIDSFSLAVFPCGSRNKKWEYFDGGCYYFSVQKATWQQAKTQCENQNSHLVVIDNVAEQNFLESHTKNILYYIGLTDVAVEGQWRWVDGTNYEKGFKKWLEGEPNNSGKNEHCAHLNRDGKWNDVPCDRTYFYVCEKTPPSRSTMR